MNMTILESKNNIEIEDDNIKYSKNQINKLINNKRLDLSENLLFDISSDKFTEKECYNDYMLTLKEPIKIKDININNIKIPKKLMKILIITIINY